MLAFVNMKMRAAFAHTISKPSYDRVRDVRRHTKNLITTRISNEVRFITHNALSNKENASKRKDFNNDQQSSFRTL
jgi:hypothetical protein